MYIYLNTYKIFKTKIKTKKKKKHKWQLKPDNLFKKYSEKIKTYMGRTENNYMNIRPVHYFNDILYTSWPFYIGFSIFFFLFFFVLSLKQIDIAYYFIFISLFSFLCMLAGWFKDMIVESVIYGKYSRKLRQALNYGFILFLVSEIFLFVGFFWGYFDRIFDPVVLSGNNSLPFGIEPLYKNIKPIFATFLLVCSGFLINLSYISIKYSWMRALQFSYGSIILGGLFLFIQYMEYTTLLFTINDNVFCSSFYMLTGFHGFHVIVGLIFLLIQQERLYICEFTRQRQQGFVLGVMYWHFVDYIWIFLFISVYVLNWALTYYYFNMNIFDTTQYLSILLLSTNLNNEDKKILWTKEIEQKWEKNKTMKLNLENTKLIEKNKKKNIELNLEDIKLIEKNKRIKRNRQLNYMRPYIWEIRFDRVIAKDVPNKVMRRWEYISIKLAKKYMLLFDKYKCGIWQNVKLTSYCDAGGYFMCKFK